MPYELRWVPAPKDESLIVHTERLEETCYRCRYCDGWIEGKPYCSRVDNMARLSGRRGTVEYCQRCGQEINFFGMVS